MRDRGKAARVLGRRGIDLDDPRVTVVVGDMLDDEAVAAAVAGCDATIHCAAAIGVTSGGAVAVTEQNVGGTRAVVGAAVAASGLPITPDDDRAAIVRQRYTPPPTTAETSGVLFACAFATRCIATRSGRTASIIEVSASQACISPDCVSRIPAIASAAAYQYVNCTIGTPSFGVRSSVMLRSAFSLPPCAFSSTTRRNPWRSTERQTPSTTP